MSKKKLTVWPELQFRPHSHQAKFLRIMIDTKLFDDRVLNIKEHFDKAIKSPISVVSDELQNKHSKNANGIYLFSEITDNTEAFMYVGQSNNIYERLCEHCAIKDYKRLILHISSPCN